MTDTRYMETATATKTDRDQYLDDLITTAVEGGINYWAAVSDYEWSDDGPTSVVVYDLEAGDLDGPGVPIGRAEIRKALALIMDATHEIKYLHSGARGRIFAATMENDAAEIDADDADTIMQVAVLGEIVYG